MNRTLHLVYNPQSGQGLAKELPKLAERIAQQADWQLKTYEMNPAEDLDHLLERVLKNQKQDQGRLVAAGGDGTLRTVIQKISGSSIELAIIPSGTFNIFARTHEIPLDHEEALKIAMQGKAEKVRLGSFNDHVFLINGNIGLYAKAIHERRTWVKALGRNRLVASVATLWTFFKEFRPLRLKLHGANLEKDVKASLIFIGNSPLQLEKINLKYGSSENLAFVIVKDLTITDRLRLLWKGMWGGLQDENKLELHSLPELKIDSKKPRHKIILDGESLELSPPFIVKSLNEGVNLVKPLVGNDL